MISWIIFGGMTIIALIYLAASWSSFFTVDGRGGWDEKKDNAPIKWAIIPVILFLVGIVAATFQPLAVTRIEAGSVGIKVKLIGDERGIGKYEYKSGWVVYNTYTEQIFEFPTFQQHIDYPITTVITKGGFSAVINPSFNYALVPNAVGDMFSNLRVDLKQVEQNWLKTAIIGSVNNVTNRWAVDSIFNHREDFENAIVTECNKHVSKWFTVSQLRTNIVPPPALKEAIESKTRAIQEAQAAENQRFVAEKQAQIKIATARGDSAQQVIAAQAEAEAIKLKQVTLSPLYVEWLKWVNADPNVPRVPTTILGSNSSALLQVK